MKLKTLLITSFFLFFQTQYCYAIHAKKIHALASSFMQNNEVEGMSIALIDRDNISFFNYGFADKTHNIKTTNNTIYTIASFTKTFTATLTAIAAVEGKLSLDDPFIKYFPDVSYNHHLDNIKVGELLAHVSSLPFDFNPRPKTYSSLVKSLNQFASQTTPGSVYHYSNAGIGTVGYVLQNIYGSAYQNILATKLLSPLKMHSTFLYVPKEKEKYIALGHDESNKTIPYDNNIEVWFAAASLKSTISDMASYLSAHINPGSYHNSNLTKAILMVHKNKYCFDDNVSCEQLAWQAHVISELNNNIGETHFLHFDQSGFPVFGTKKIIQNDHFSDNQIFIDKTGAGYGMSSYMTYIPEKKIGVVILLNKWIGNERIKLGRDILKSLII